MIYETLHDKWQAIISDDGREITFCHNGATVVSAPSLVWSLLRPLRSEIGSGLRLRTPSAQYGEYTIATDVLAYTMTITRDGETLLTLTGAEIDSLYATMRATLTAYRQASRS